MVMSYLFTFQYGQIYYQLDSAQQLKMIQYLHSNMVRFIMRKNET